MMPSFTNREAFDLLANARDDIVAAKERRDSADPGGMTVEGRASADEEYDDEVERIVFELFQAIGVTI